MTHPRPPAAASLRPARPVPAPCAPPIHYPVESVERTVELAPDRCRSPERFRIAGLRSADGDPIHREVDMLETRSAGEAGSSVLPVATPDEHCCNRLREPLPAFPPGPEEGLAMEDLLLRRMMEDPEWARGVIDPEARIDDAEWTEKEELAAWRREQLAQE